MKAAVFEQFGNPAEVLKVRDAPVPEPQPGEVRVRMIASPVNPSDMMVVRGQYGRLPQLPATPGFEGVGIIDKTTPGLIRLVRRLKPGMRVAVLNSIGGNWQEFVTVPARQVVPIPDNIPDIQAASFFVNPATAVVMTAYVLRVPNGAWLLQTAAGGALGRMIIRLGKHRGFRTLNLVRRSEQVEELKRLGADQVLATGDPDLERRINEITKGQGVSYAIDPVGGETSLYALKALGANGLLLLYGSLANQPIPLDPRLVIGGQRRIEGFWLSDWVKNQNPLTMLGLFRQLTSLIQSGVLTTQPGREFPLENIAEAAREADKSARTGKVLLRIGSA